MTCHICNGKGWYHEYLDSTGNSSVKVNCKNCDATGYADPPAIHYDFKPMEWEYDEGYKCYSSDKLYYVIYQTETNCFSLWLSSDEGWENTYPSLDEAKAAAEKHRQGLIEKLGGVRV